MDSVQPNLSCINTAHVSVGLDPPASGPGAERTSILATQAAAAAPAAGKSLGTFPPLVFSFATYGVGNMLIVYL